ncbi:hypothetical protein H6P81_006609 [Aristolochia fimbriata]|uniref:Uncharacterized protein n=1 Tax=Aristolochia fimbriata TaxID=158543 RepID=A0AAV7EXT0_ARIFI|nr:hypothetical protein H6P81_006609 [Aristolochia fimbriata]
MATKEPKKRRWPAIRPKKEMQIMRLKDTDLFTIPNFFTAAESKAFVDAAEAVGFIHQGSLGPARGEAYRDNDRIAIDDPSLAASMWDSGLNTVFADIKIRGKVAVGLNPNIRFYREALYGKAINQRGTIWFGTKQALGLEPLLRIWGVLICNNYRETRNTHTQSARIVTSSNMKSRGLFLEDMLAE